MILPLAQQYTSCAPDMQDVAPLIELAAHWSPDPHAGVPPEQAPLLMVYPDGQQ